MDLVGFVRALLDGGTLENLTANDLQPLSMSSCDSFHIKII